MKKQLIILAILATIINSLAGCAGTDWRAVRRDAGAILFVVGWMWGVIILIRMSQTYRSLSYYVLQ